MSHVKCLESQRLGQLHRIQIHVYILSARYALWRLGQRRNSYTSPPVRVWAFTVWITVEVYFFHFRVLSSPLGYVRRPRFRFLLASTTGLIWYAMVNVSMRLTCPINFHTFLCMVMGISSGFFGNQLLVLGQNILRICPR